ncbi:hypothetical protein CYG48_05025 [Neorhizobium sp. SOG26]|uniref:phage capsid protein n=1 Tax=Neorhizobium sp. SOG26 TaxID=2060726 RepID=UPI000E581D3C|nr:phage capsid protein [Neorhizobium sp. SOG26]AXV15117.1 hypothetical protein CYG48_05025 [Neorhizobium sp. SOG26]
MTYMITAAQYRDEWVHEFQRGETYLKDTVSRETITHGHSSAVFAIAGQSSGMSERGVNGLIPTRNATDRQVTVELKEKHSLENQTSFNVFTSQGGKLREAMQKRSRMDAVREIDDEIIRALSTATNVYNSGTAITMTFARMTDIISDLWEGNVDERVTFLHTPKSWARMLGWQQFTSADYVDRKPLMGDAPRPIMFANAWHMLHNGLTGRTTNSAAMYVYAKSAVGHALATGEIKVAAGYNEEQDYSWDRATIYHRAVILQQAGVLRVNHDDSAAIS